MTEHVDMPLKGVLMKKLLYAAAGIAVGSAVAWAFIHRRVIAASIKGEPLPEPPAWHKAHPCIKAH